MWSITDTSARFNTEIFLGSLYQINFCDLFNFQKNRKLFWFHSDSLNELVLND